VKVAYDSRSVTDPDGVGRYSRCLLRALRETIDEGEEIAETHRPRGADVFHAPHMDSAMLHCPVPMVVTLHNLTALKRRSEYLRTGVRMRLRHLAVQRAMRVIVSSETVAADAYEGLGLEPDRVAVIHEAPDPRLYERSEEEVALARERFGLPDRYLVWVGGLRHPDPGKHLTKLAATPHELPLVLVGPTCPWAHELPNVTLTGEASDDELAAIYSGAHALVMPSQHDVSALSALEALACGTPVVACENPALREALDGRATFVEAGDMRALVLAGESAERPAPAPPPWTWHDAARATWSVYRQALACADGPQTTARQLRVRPYGGFSSSFTRPQ
jgi:glycosyltransferase involved in cell wall biosynthesis